MDIIIKQNNTQKVFLSEENIDVSEILKEYYSYIYDSIKKEEFILKYGQCNLFKELVFERKVVGFCSYDFSRDFMTYALNNIYILPEFRGNSIFKKELEKTMEEQNKPSIMEPTRFVVELLIKYGFARKISENIVASALEFVIPGSNVLSNADYGNEELSTHFYDLNICASIHILDIDRSHIAYSALMNYDIDNYDCIESRANMDDEYFKGITQFFTDHSVDIMETMLELEDNLPIKSYTLEEIIGPEGEFSFYIESLIDDAHVTHSKALEIKKQIKEEYEAGMILNESLLIRLSYLFNENMSPAVSSHDEICPYCSMPIDSHDRFCHFCGINLNYDPDIMQDSLINAVSVNESDFSEDIRFIAYKFLKLIDEKIDIDYSIFTIEQTYNISWDTLNDYLKINDYFIDYQITSEGYHFLNSHPLHFWNKYQMDIVDYTDFENYFYAHINLNPKEICLSYLKQFDDDEYIIEIINEINNDCSNNN